MAQPDAIQKEPWAGSLIGTEKRPHPPMKAELNRKILVAERSCYRNFWSEIQCMVNDLGTMSAALVNQWGIAKQSGSASAVDTSATYASYRAHEDRARSLA